MGIGAIGFQPYIYNTNTINRASMNRVKPVEDDVTKASTDYSALTDNSQNVNPLKRGESANFVDILESQMAMSRQNAARLLVPSDEML
ncbi:MAG: hypothetical protein MJZ11_11185 [Lachnospiraceae bacterium]|nr:hypothetical protein [Lachnospiraceae bacterium]